MNNKKNILDTHPHLKDFLDFLPKLNEESDRGAVLIAATMIEDLLEKVLHSFLIKGKTADRLLTGFNAPLGTFSAKIAACAAMGLITDNEHEDIEIIRKVRNDFAHTIHMSFKTQKIVDHCSKLHHSAKSYDDVIVGSKGQFTTGATSIILNLTNRPHYVEKTKITKRNWPY
ncbi:DUF4145 domain-containing protein [Mucilaginibacter pallidiroseus]|uniref:DUF4145 domain-containing protein n=1 Tax=Mucilaginibacter pallidiroseus TaxID=2599295 RepID=A0A563UJ81_9SPHI|nr:DUF4145 domain-containing protein [Mucilaginibacter pallidiroseus]TWR31427.1 DUF4145 domain-containing protein [Mucilaginibacter pallidiroseus]